MDERRLKEKLSGRTRYPINVSSKNQNYIRIITAPAARGILESIEIPEMPESCGFLGPEDIPGKNLLSLGMGEMPLLADKEFHFKGEFLGVIYAPDQASANSLASRVKIHYKEKPPLPELNLSDLKNCAYQQEIRKGQTEEILENTDNFLLEDYYEFKGMTTGNITPPHSSCQRDGNKLTLHVVTQWPWIIQKNLSKLLKIKKENIRIKTYPIENNQDSYLLSSLRSALISALVSFHTKKTSTLVIHPRNESLNSCNTGATQIYIKGACNRQGKLLALKVDFIHETGAYALFSKEIVDRICLAVTGAYQCRNVEIHGKSQYTTRAPVVLGSDGANSPILTSLEMFCFQLSQQTKMNIKEWKQCNILQKGNSYYTGFSFTKDLKLDQLLERVTELSDFDRKNAAYQYRSSREHDKIYGRRRGIGLSIGFIGNGYMSGQGEMNSMQISMKLEQDGSLEIWLPHPVGHSQLYRHWKILAAEILILERKNINIYINDTQEPLSNGPSSMGRNVTVLNHLIQLCLQKISKRRFRDPLPIEENIRFRKSRRKWDEENFEGMAYQHLSWGASVVELEILEGNNDIEILNYWSVLDTGPLIIPSLKESIVDQGLKQCSQWLDFRIQPTSGIYTMYPQIPSITEIMNNGNQCKSFDGLTQTLFPAAFLQALSQAKGTNQHFIPLHFSDEEMP